MAQVGDYNPQSCVGDYMSELHVLPPITACADGARAATATTSPTNTSSRSPSLETSQTNATSAVSPASASASASAGAGTGAGGVVQSSTLSSQGSNSTLPREQPTQQSQLQMQLSSTSASASASVSATAQQSVCSPEVVAKVSQLHRMLRGMVPELAEYVYLDKVKWLEQYGLALYPSASPNIFVGLSPFGFVLCKLRTELPLSLSAGGGGGGGGGAQQSQSTQQQGARLTQYLWPRVIDVKSREKLLLLKTRSDTKEDYTHQFVLRSKELAKALCAHAVDTLDFFRRTHLGPDASASAAGRADEDQSQSASAPATPEHAAAHTKGSSSKHKQHGTPPMKRRDATASGAAAAAANLNSSCGQPDAQSSSGPVPNFGTSRVVSFRAPYTEKERENDENSLTKEALAARAHESRHRHALPPPPPGSFLQPNGAASGALNPIFGLSDANAATGAAGEFLGRQRYESDDDDCSSDVSIPGVYDYKSPYLALNNLNGPPPPFGIAIQMQSAGIGAGGPRRCRMSQQHSQHRCSHSAHQHGAGGRARLPQELLSHIQFGLVDPASLGLSVDEVRDIPFTNVQLATPQSQLAARSSDCIRARYHRYKRLGGSGSALNNSAGLSDASCPPTVQSSRSYSYSYSLPAPPPPPQLAMAMAMGTSAISTSAAAAPNGPLNGSTATTTPTPPPLVSNANASFALPPMNDTRVFPNPSQVLTMSLPPTSSALYFQQPATYPAVGVGASHSYMASQLQPSQSCFQQPAPSAAAADAQALPSSFTTSNNSSLSNCTMLSPISIAPQEAPYAPHAPHLLQTAASASASSNAEQRMYSYSYSAQQVSSTSASTSAPPPPPPPPLRVTVGSSSAASPHGSQPKLLSLSRAPPHPPPYAVALATSAAAPVASASRRPQSRHLVTQI